MTQLDLLYREFGKLYKSLKKDRESSLLCDAIIHADERDKIVVMKVHCKIDEDWVEAIEKGLVFIGKAIDEDRQFIRSNGEVLQIERVRHVSRSSVEHLGRHSDYISREMQNGDIIPDRLYVEERTNDYTVYENRFLYMLLCKLRDFVSLRYNSIVKICNTYEGEFHATKHVSFGGHRLEYNINLKDKRDNDWFMRTNNSIAGILDRLEAIQRSIYCYLQTPLMSEVAKADEIKPPISKTNVLRMDKNFKETVNLYEFIMAYQKDGFSVTKQETVLDPLDDKVAEELAVPAILTSFLTYEHGLNLKDYLQKEFEKEEERRKEEERLLTLEKIKNLRRRIQESALDAEQYIQLLESRVTELEKDNDRYALAKEEIENLGMQVESLEKELKAQRVKAEELKASHINEIGVYTAKIEDLRRESAIKASEHAEAIAQLEREKHEELNRKNIEYTSILSDLSKVKEEKALSDARLTALRKEHGLLTPNDDFTSEEAFNELEHEYEILGMMVRSEWKGVKKMLRKEFFGNIKKVVNGKQKIQKNSNIEPNTTDSSGNEYVITDKSNDNENIRQLSGEENDNGN